MPDVLAVAALIVFFSTAVLFVRACERIIGPDLEAEAAVTDADSGHLDSEAAAA